MSKTAPRELPPTYRTESPQDMHQALRVDVLSPNQYRVVAPDGVLCVLNFQSKCIRPLPEGAQDIDGLTNEVLLAVVMDRLERFQKGEFACSENGIALEHIARALESLKDRTRRRYAAGVLNTRAEEKTAVDRIRKEGEHLHVGNAMILLANLETWQGWSAVEIAVKQLLHEEGAPPLSEAELALLAGCAKERAGQNGHKEFLQAYRQTGR